MAGEIRFYLNGEETIYTGNGDTIEDTFQVMKETAQEGEYLLTFQLEDINGRTYKLAHSFFILRE